MARASFDPPEHLPKQALRQGAFGQLEDEDKQSRLPDEVRADLEEPGALPSTAPLAGHRVALIFLMCRRGPRLRPAGLQRDGRWPRVSSLPHSEGYNAVMDVLIRRRLGRGGSVAQLRGAQQ